jgi:REP element-mobilizing transposase RayT
MLSHGRKSGRNEVRPSTYWSKTRIKMELNIKKLPERHQPVHWPFLDKFGRPNIIFVTVCSKDRKKIFANEHAHKCFTDSWKQAREWLVGKYVIMPEHIHFFCAPSGVDIHSLRGWVKYWKSLVSFNWHSADEHPIWQKDFWDRQLRKGESYSRKWEYVSLNPIRYGLVDKVELWPYQGELVRFFW